MSIRKLQNSYARLYISSVLVAAISATTVSPVAAIAADGVVNGTFVEGSGTITHTDPNHTTITVHDRSTIANFDEYNIGENQGVHYNHDLDGGYANHLSRVTGANPTSILGSLTSDHVNVFLINPNGVFFGQTATVDVPNLVASTTGITNGNFMAGNYKFDVKGKPGASVVNKGNIKIQDAGLAAFVAPNVTNEGLIVATKGKVALAAGDEFTLDMYGDKLIKFSVASESNGGNKVDQKGTIKAEDGYVLLTTQQVEQVVNNVVNVDGVVEAKDVHIEGDEIVLGEDTVITAKDGNNGGKVVIGDSRKASIRDSKKTTVATGAKITADATTDGDAGEIYLFGKQLNTDGKLSAQGKGAGKGGFIETSGDEVNIGDNTDVNTLDEQGGSGLWLIDPINITIAGTDSPPGNIKGSTLAGNLRGGSITIDTSIHGNIAGQLGDININDNINVDGQNYIISNPPEFRTLTFNANNNINIASGKTIGISGIRFNGLIPQEAKLNVNLNANGNIVNNGTINTKGGSLLVKGFTQAHAGSFYNKGTINTGSGATTITAGWVASDVGKDITAGSFTATTFGNITLDGNVTTGNALAGGDITLKSNGDVQFGGNAKTNGGKITVEGNGTSHALRFTTFGEVNTKGLVDTVAGAVDVKAGQIITNGAINTNGSVSAGNVSLVSNGTGAITINNAINALNAAGTSANIKIENTNNTITTTAAGVLNASDVNIKSINGDITLNGAITAKKIGTGGKVTVESSNGTISNNAPITASNLTSTGGGEIKLDTATGVLNVNNKLQVGDLGVVNLRGGRVNIASTALIDTTLAGLAGGAVNITSSPTPHPLDPNYGRIDMDGTINTVGSVSSGAVTLAATGSDINIRGTIDASGLLPGNVTATTTGAGNIATGALSSIKAGKVKLQTAAGDITHNGTIRATESGLLGKSVELLTVDGDIEINNDITAGTDLLGVLGGGAIDIKSTNGTVKLLHDINIGGLGTVYIEAGDHVDLDGKVKGGNINSTILSLFGGVLPPELASLAGLELFTLTGKTDVVNVLSDNATINQGVKIVNAGGEVNLTAGETYNQTVRINKALTLDGHGAKIAPTGALPIIVNNWDGLSLTTVAPQGYIPAIGSLPVAVQPIVFVDGGMTGAGISNVTIKNVEVDGSGVDATLAGGKTGIGFYNASGRVKDSSVHDLYDTLPTAHGIHADAGTGTHTVDIDNVDVFKYQLAGIHATGAKTTLNVKNTSTITGDGLLAGLAQLGVVYDNGAGGKVSDSTITDNFSLLSAGVAAINAGKVEVVNNTITGNETGITAINTNGVYTESNDISGSLAGVAVENSDDFWIIDSNITGNGVGVLANESDGLFIDPTIISGNLVGVALINSDDAHILTSSIYLNLIGVHADSSTGLIIDDSDIYLNLIGVNLTNGSNNATFKNGDLYLNLAGINADASTGLTVDNANVFLNLAGVNLANGSNGATVKGSNVFLNLAGVQADASTGLTVDDSNVFLNLVGVDLQNGSNGATVKNNSNVFLNLTGVNADASTGLTVDDSNVFLNLVGVNLENGSDTATVKNSNVFLNQTGVNANASETLTVDNSNVFLNQTGINAENGSNGATVKNSNVFLNQTGVQTNASANLTVDNTNVFLNEIGVNAINGSLNATVKNSRVFLNQTGFNIAGGSDNASSSNSLYLLNNDGIKANGSDGLNVSTSAFILNNDGIDLQNGSDNAVVTTSLFLLNNNGIKANASDNLTVGLSAFALNNNGINLQNDSDDATVGGSLFVLNNNGIKANDSDGLTVALSAFALNNNGINLQNGSDNALVLGSVFALNNNGILADDSNNLGVGLSAFVLNNNGIKLQNDSDNATVVGSLFALNNNGINANDSDNLDVILSGFIGNRTGINLENGSDNADVIASLFALNRTGINANDSNNLDVYLSAFIANRTGINLENDSDNADVVGSLFALNRTGINANDSDNLDVTLSAFLGNRTGINLENDSDNADVLLSAFIGNRTGIRANDSDNLDVNLSLFALNRTGVELLNDSDDADITNSAFVGNLRGVRATDSDRLTIDNSFFALNGSGVVLRNGSDFAKITDSNFALNGFGIRSNNSDDALIRNVGFYNNGVGVSARNSDRLTVKDSTFTNNFIGAYLFNSDAATFQNTAFNSNGGPFAMLVDADNKDLNITLTDVTFNGNNSTAALQFQNAAKVNGVDVSNVKFLGTGPVAWRFVNVKGDGVEDVYSASGDLDFKDTTFGDTYGYAIELVDSIMDGDAENATFVNDGGSAAVREARVWHTVDDSPEGTIFYKGFGAPGFGFLFGDLANRTDLAEVYYHAVSTVGKLFDDPSLTSAKARSFNITNDGKVSINSATKLANLQPAAGGNVGTDATNLSNLEPASGGSSGGGNIPNAGGNCAADFGNSFLGDDVNLATANGTCL